MSNYNFHTLKNVKDVAKKFGYTVRKNDNELELYPKGQRGDKSYYTDDYGDAICTVRAMAQYNFKQAIEDEINSEELASALCEWFKAHGDSWKDALYNAWYTGSYGSTFATNNVSSVLQKFRNGNGHEVVAKIK